MKHSSILFLLTLAALLLWQCSKNTSDPPPVDNEPDTTSHSFTWTLDTVGTFGSVLFDVAIVNENDIWAVGEIHTAETDTFDSLGNWVPPYNAVHWNGSEWALMRIPFKIFCNQPATQISPAKSVLAFASNDIWITAGSQITHWNGNQFDLLECIPVSVNKMWGTFGNDIYVVGAIGGIAHYNGSSWQKLDSGTEVRLLDVYGSPDGSVVWACGYASNNSESILLRYDGNQWQTKWYWHYQQGSTDSTYEGLLRSLWAFHSDSLIIVGGNGIYRQDMQGKSPPRNENLNLDAFPLGVHGSAANNIFICGDNGRVWHYNGATWQTYLELHNSNWVFRSIAGLKNMAITVGEDFSQGIQRDIIVTGRRP